MTNEQLKKLEKDLWDSVLNLFLELVDSETAKEYLKAVIQNVIKRNTYNNFLPDANNSIENVIKFRMTGTKPVFYSDSTSPLLSMLFIYVVSRQAQPDKHLVLELSH